MQGFAIGGPVKSTETTASHLALGPAYRTWLDHLRILYPIRGVLHVGAGTGASACLYEEWGVSKVAYIEADKSRLARLTDAIKNHAGWTAHGELLSDRSCETIFYRASNLNESGMLVPEELSPLWRNLKSLEQQKLPTTTIEAFLESGAQGIVATDFNWVHVDCLPSVAILRGAGEFLGEWDVVIARALMNEGLLQARLGTGKGALGRFMAEHGFVCITHTEERHPAMGQLLFVRNWKTELKRQLETSELNWQKQAVGLQAQLDRLEDERDSQRRLAEQRQSETTRLTSECDEEKNQNAKLNSRLAVIGQELARLREERDAQRQLAEQGQSDVARMTTERDEAKKQKDELSSRLAEVSQELARLREERDAQRQLAEQGQSNVARMTTERDEAKKQKDELRSCLAEVSQELARLTEERDAQRQLAEQGQSDVARMTTERDEAKKTER